MEKRKKEYTLKRHLAEFLVFVIGSMICLNVFTLIFSSNSNEKYRQASYNIRSLEEFAITQEQAMKYLRRYVLYDALEEDYLQLKIYLKQGEDSLDYLFDNTNDKDTLRRLYNLMKVHTFLEEKAENVKNMVAEKNSEEEWQRQIDTAYAEAVSVYDVLLEEYDTVNRQYLTYVDKISENLRVRRMWFLGCYLIVFLGVCVYLWREISEIYNSVLLPVQELVHGARRIGEGEFEEIHPGHGKVEMDKDISLLVHIFNQMTDKLKQQIAVLQENIRIQKELEASKYRELQMQINPHFMFNTLNMIAETAYFENAEKTEFLMNKTAKMFRFSLDFSGKSISLFKEIEELENYIFIQEEQYEDRIEFLFDLDESFHNILVPSLTLQPLIENSVVHGIGKYTEGGRVKLTTSYHEEEGAGYIMVEDNGVGIEEEKLQQIRQEMINYKGDSMKIGLGNVYSRLKILYGEKVSMDIESEERKGCKITIRIEGI